MLVVYVKVARKYQNNLTNDRIPKLTYFWHSGGKLGLLLDTYRFLFWSVSIAWTCAASQREGREMEIRPPCCECSASSSSSSSSLSFSSQLSSTLRSVAATAGPAPLTLWLSSPPPQQQQAKSLQIHWGHRRPSPPGSIKERLRRLVPPPLPVLALFGFFFLVLCAHSRHRTAGLLPLTSHSCKVGCCA